MRKNTWPIRGKNLLKIHEQKYFESQVRRKGERKTGFCYLPIIWQKCKNLYTSFHPFPIFLQLFKIFYERETPRGSCDQWMWAKLIYLLLWSTSSPGIYKDLDNKCIFLSSCNFYKENNPSIGGIFFNILWRVFCQLRVRHMFEKLSNTSHLYYLSLVNLGVDPNKDRTVLAELPAYTSNLPVVWVSHLKRWFLRSRKVILSDGWHRRSRGDRSPPSPAQTAEFWKK